MPVLLKVIGRGALVVLRDWLPKVRLAVERLATAAVPTPVPVRFTACGLPGALSVILTAAE